MTYVTFELNYDFELDYQITMIELSFKDELHPTNLTDIHIDDDRNENSFYDAMV